MVAAVNAGLVVVVPALVNAVVALETAVTVRQVTTAETVVITVFSVA